MEFKYSDILEGEFVTLKKVELQDALDIYTWRTSRSGRYLQHPSNYSVESQQEWIRNRSAAEINYIIYPKKLQTKVGMIGIYDVRSHDLVADVGRLLLSEEYLQKSNPYGLESLLLTYDYVFNTMNFRKISGTILGVNVDMFTFQKYLGMKQEGYLKQHVIIKDKCEDLYVMSLFKDEFIQYKNKIQFLLRSFRTVPT